MEHVNDKPSLNVPILIYTYDLSIYGRYKLQFTTGTIRYAHHLLASTTQFSGPIKTSYI